MSDHGTVVLGVLSDTHGLLRPELFEVFEGVDRILHAGDVGGPSILDDLEALAPVHAVWGNVDGSKVRERAREAITVEVAGLSVGMAHGHRLAPAYDRLLAQFPEADLIVHGHSHEPSLRRLGDVLLLDPGSAGHRRFRNPVTAALVRLGRDGPRVEFVELETGRRSADPADLVPGRTPPGQ